MQSTFSQRVVELALAIPPGRVTTYGTLAKVAGGGGQAARSISSILSKFDNPGMIPWHRIVYAGGKAWLSTDATKAAERREQLAVEGIELDSKGIVRDFDELLYNFN